MLFLWLIIFIWDFIYACHLCNFAQFQYFMISLFCVNIFFSLEHFLLDFFFVFLLGEKCLNKTCLLCDSIKFGVCMSFCVGTTTKKWFLFKSKKAEKWIGLVHRMCVMRSVCERDKIDGGTHIYTHTNSVH